jgi:hypothetical protein
MVRQNSDLLNQSTENVQYMLPLLLASLLWSAVVQNPFCSNNISKIRIGCMSLLVKRQYIFHS